MPLTPFQKEVMSVLAAERHEASHMACGKDAGFNPLSLFQMVMRFARIDPVDLDKIKAATSIPSCSSRNGSWPAIRRGRN